MQRKILKSKDRIALISGILIALAFLNHFVLHYPTVSEVLLIIASIIGVAPIAIQAFGALRIKLVSIDVLVTIAVIGAFVIRNYEESAIVTFLFLFGGYLEQRTLKQTRSAIKELVDMAPETAWKQMEDGTYEEVEIDEVDKGDVLQVRTGAMVPVDGKVTSGEGHVNEASITGESFPVKKALGDQVFAGTILENGTLLLEADRVGEDTTFGRIIELVEEAQDSKSEAERFIDRFSQYYTPLVLLIALVVGFITRDIELAVTILVLGCPGALVIGVPVSNVAGIGNGAKNGVLLKGSEVINDFSKADTIIFDKTGTLTVGNPSVADVAYFVDGQEKADLLSSLVSVERESDHPLATAILDEHPEVPSIDVTDTHVVKGGGIVAKAADKEVTVGNIALMKSRGITFDANQERLLEEYEKRGDSLVLVAIEDKLGAIYGIRDQIRPQAKEKLAELKELGVKNLIMLSGDNQGTVDVVSKELGLTEAYGNMLPEDKSAFVAKKIEEGHIVAFLGDGVNDSPSIALAQVGIAMGAGTDVAIETSDVVLMNSDISKLPHAVALAKATSRNMKQNIIIAVGVVLFLLASLIFSEWMNMAIGMLVHEGSILVVILNGMRLINFRLKNRGAQVQPDSPEAKATNR